MTPQDLALVSQLAGALIVAAGIWLVWLPVKTAVRQLFGYDDPDFSDVDELARHDRKAHR